MEPILSKRKKETSWLQNFPWGDLNENGISNRRKLLMHGYKFSIAGDIKANEEFRERNYSPGRNCRVDTVFLEWATVVPRSIFQKGKCQIARFPR